MLAENFTALAGFARKYVKDLDTAKEIAHDVFINLWEKRNEIDSEKPLRSYLFTSVRNRCLNYIRDQKKFDKTGKRDCFVSGGYKNIKKEIFIIR